MWSDVLDLEEFYSSTLGQMTARLLRARLRDVWPSVRGEAVLGLEAALAAGDYRAAQAALTAAYRKSPGPEILFTLGKVAAAGANEPLDPKDPPPDRPGGIVPDRAGRADAPRPDPVGRGDEHAQLSLAQQPDGGGHVLPRGQGAQVQSGVETGDPRFPLVRIGPFQLVLARVAGARADGARSVVLNTP